MAAASAREQRDSADGKTREQSATLRRIILSLCKRYPSLTESVLPGQTIEVSPGRFHTVDICLLSADAREEEIVHFPPDLCIEILAGGETPDSIAPQLNDYFAMGVPTCWLVDPHGRHAWVAKHGQVTQVADGVLRASELEVPLPEILDPVSDHG